MQCVKPPTSQLHRRHRCTAPPSLPLRAWALPSEASGPGFFRQKQMEIGWEMWRIPWENPMWRYGKPYHMGIWEYFPIVSHVVIWEKMGKYGKIWQHVRNYGKIRLDILVDIMDKYSGWCLSLPLWKIWESVGTITPNIWEKKTVANHQPDEYSDDWLFFLEVTVHCKSEYKKKKSRSFVVSWTCFNIFSQWSCWNLKPI